MFNKTQCFLVFDNGVTILRVIGDPHEIRDYIEDSDTKTIEIQVTNEKGEDPQTCWIRLKNIMCVQEVVENE